MVAIMDTNNWASTEDNSEFLREECEVRVRRARCASLFTQFDSGHSTDIGWSPASRRKLERLVAGLRRLRVILAISDHFQAAMHCACKRRY